MPRVREARLSTLLLLAALACGSTPAPAPASPAGASPDDSLTELEQRLLAAPTFQIRARAITGGRIVSRFEGVLVAAPAGKMRFAFEGSFGNRDAVARLVSDGARMRGGGAQTTFDLEAPPGLREGVVVSFVRMGITHDLAVLSEGKPPDYLDGHARLHVRAIEVWHEPGEAIRGAPTERWAWELLVDDRRAADEKLWIDTRTGLPLQRRAVVHFPEGDMDVAEDYDTVSLGEREDDAFAVSPETRPRLTK